VSIRKPLIFNEAGFYSGGKPLSGGGIQGYGVRFACDTLFSSNS
jgi:hypothetical protein